MNRDTHPHRCTDTAAAPSAPSINPDGRCRNVVSALLWDAGERRCYLHGGERLRVATAAALLARAKARR